MSSSLISCIIKKKKTFSISSVFLVSLQQFGKILDVEIIFNERGSKVLDCFQFPTVKLLTF